jgi:hypothetical protein
VRERESRWYHEALFVLGEEGFCVFERFRETGWVMTTKKQSADKLSKGGKQRANSASSGANGANGVSNGNGARMEMFAKAYEPQAVEGRLYRWWEENGYFKPRPSKNPDRRPFVISMPPPNVTGALHLGHAITATLEDIMIRYHRMLGDETLWVPGEDHAGIATQAVVERELAKEGTDRRQIGREAFVERVWDWVRRYKSRIQDQHRRLGASCDWER